VKLRMLFPCLVVLIALAALAYAEDDPQSPAANTYKDPSIEELKQFAGTPKTSDLSQKGTPWDTSSLSEKAAAAQAAVLSQTGSPNYVESADLFFDDAAANNFFTMTVADFLAQMAADPNWIVLDIRPSDLYAQGHIPGAMSLPFTELVTLMSTIPENKKVAVYCSNDSNAAYAVMTLRVFGDRDAWVLLGGVPSWQAAGQAVE